MPHETVPEMLIFERAPEDWVGPDCWFAFQSVLAVDGTGGRRLGWLRRWGGPRLAEENRAIDPHHPWSAPPD
jgi:hypothetical protein